MAEMNRTLIRANRKSGPPIDVSGFAAQIQKQADTLAESGWAHEAVGLRKWASELRGKTVKTDYTDDGLPSSAK